jgi:hypothetical protein
LGPDENEAAKNRAEWITGRYKDRGKNVKLLKDTEVTDDMLKSNDFLLYGGPSVNRIVQEMQDKLPVHFQGKGFVYNDKVYDESSMGVDFAAKNPYNGDKYIAVYAGNSAEAQLDCHSVMNGPTSIVIYNGKELLTDDFF